MEKDKEILKKCAATLRECAEIYDKLSDSDLTEDKEEELCALLIVKLARLKE